MLQILLGVLVVGFIWRTVGVTVAKKGRRDGLGYQVLAVVAFLGGGFAGAVAALVLVNPETSNFALAALINFVAPFVTGGLCASVIAVWASHLAPTEAAARRIQETAEFNPFDDGPATPTKHDNPPRPTGHDI